MHLAASHRLPLTTFVAPPRSVALLFRHRRRLFRRFFTVYNSISSERKKKATRKPINEGRRTSGWAGEPKRQRKTGRRERWSVTGNRTFRVNLNSKVISIFNFIKKIRWGKLSFLARLSNCEMNRTPSADTMKRKRTKKRMKGGAEMQASWFT